MAKSKDRFEYRTLEAAFGIDSHYRIVFWNRGAKEMTGLQRRDVFGRKCYDIIQAYDLSGNPFCFRGCQVMKTHEQGGMAKSINLELLTKSGRVEGVDMITLHLNRDGSPAQPVLVHFVKPFVGAAESSSRAKLTRVQLEKIVHGPLKKNFSLSHRECEVYLAFAQGFVAKEIAVLLGLSTATVRTHIQRILKKCQVHSKVEAVALLLRHILN